MRFKLTFNLENEEIPIQYRKNIISFIKLSLENYDKNYYNKFYHNKDNIIKRYTFAVYLKDAKFNSETIQISNKSLILNISVADIETATILYNAFNNQMHKKIPMNKNSMTLINISMTPEKKITENKILIKFLSPLVVHYRNQETRKDYFYSFQDEKFPETLKLNIRLQLENTGINKEKIEELDIIPVKAKKSVIKFYEKKIEVSLGVFELHGSVELLEYLYKSGIRFKTLSRIWNV